MQGSLSLKADGAPCALGTAEGIESGRPGTGQGKEGSFWSLTLLSFLLYWHQGWISLLQDE